jgi:hypothetical protein
MQVCLTEFKFEIAEFRMLRRKDDAKTSDQELKNKGEHLQSQQRTSPLSSFAIMRECSCMFHHAI